METPISSWLTLASVSLLFFLVTALTFSSLGVVFPAMVGELHWSYSGAGFGFTLLGVFCGITATIPATLIRRFGIRATLLSGGVVMALAFAALAATHDLTLYLIGCSLSGLGFTLLATVPGTYLLTRTFRRPDIAFGLYFTVGGLGGVAGPPLYLFIQAFTGGWRDFWIVSAVLSLAVALLSALLVDTKTDVTREGGEIQEITSESWSAAAALKTPQFAVLAAAYSVFLIVDITVNAWSVQHLMGHGVSRAMAGSMISIGALVNAGARLGGGLVSRFVNVRQLLMLSLVILIAGLIALCAARDTSLMLLYAASIGIGSGLTFFSSTILLLDYYGRKPNLELFSIVNLISTVGSVGPVFGGFVADQTGSFVPAFLLLAGLVALVLVAVIWMKPPHRVAS
ncbi:MAG TPA: MFS transporter [Rhizomicrobium sp.]|jgi:OFA family oxalate/formate antiporter-like MFS transporter|nr:MFS transporter [Rhizomicrobium sp.]